MATPQINNPPTAPNWELIGLVAQHLVDYVLGPPADLSIPSVGGVRRSLAKIELDAQREIDVDVSSALAAISNRTQSLQQLLDNATAVANQALIVAEASGNYKTFATMQAALDFGFAGFDYIDINRDETRNGLRVRYDVIDGNLVFSFAFPPVVASNLKSLLEGPRVPGFITVLGSVHGDGKGAGFVYYDASFPRSDADGAQSWDPSSLDAYDGTTATFEAFINEQGSGNGTGCFRRVEACITTEQAGWFDNKAAPRILRTLIDRGVQFATPARIGSLSAQWAKWAAGEKAPIAIYGDSTTDGRVTTTDGSTLASAWNIDRLSGGAVPDGLSYDHDDSEVPNAYPNVLQRMLRAFHRQDELRVYNAGYRGKQVQDGWATDNVVNAVHDNPVYADAEWMGINFGLNDSNAANAEGLRERTYTATKALILDTYARGKQPAIFAANRSRNTADDGSDYSHNEEVLDIIEPVKRDLAAEFGIEYIDMNAMLADWFQANTDGIKIAGTAPDDLHLGDLGHRRQAEYLAVLASGGRIPTVGKKKARFSVDDPETRYTGGKSTLSGDAYKRGLNNQASIAYLTQGTLTARAGERVVDFWLWNEGQAVALDYLAYFHSGNHWENAQTPEYLPQMTLEHDLFSAGGIEDTAVYSGAVPEAVGRAGGNRLDVRYFLGGLSYGLNRVQIKIPDNIAGAIADDVIGTNYYIGHFQTTPNDARLVRPVAQYTYGLNRATIAPWRNVLRDTGPLWIPSVGLPAISDDYAYAALSPADDNANSYSLSRVGDSVEWRIKASFADRHGVVLSQQFAEISTLPDEELGSDRNKTYYSGAYAILYVSNPNTVQIATLSPANTGLNLHSLPGLESADIANKWVSLRLTRNETDMTLKIADPEDAVLFEGVITNPAILSVLGAGITGGVWITAGDAVTSATVEQMQVRQYRGVV